jgi:hypothetical protein
MPGRRLASYRSGDLNEELGILLLKGLAAVAPVPRPEDFGLDCVATLLRRDDGCFYAEGSFYVQFKTAGKSRWTFKGHEVEWLKNLKLPFFLAAVDKLTSEVSLYSGTGLGRAFILGEWEKVHLAFDGTTNRDLKPRTQEQSEQAKKTGEITIDLGEPLLKWGFRDLDKGSHFPMKAYLVLKSYLEAEHDNIVVRNLHFYEPIFWETNEWARAAGIKTMGLEWNSRFNIQAAVNAMDPHLVVILSQSMHGQYPAIFGALIDFVKVVRESGVDFKSVGVIVDQFLKLQKVAE